MRTTVTFDDDVAAQIAERRARDGRSFKQLVNDLLRAGLAHDTLAEQRQRRGSYTRPASLGRPLLPSLDDVSEALAVAEGDDHR